jgi:hypothetical protein
LVPRSMGTLSFAIFNSNLFNGLYDRTRSTQNPISKLGTGQLLKSSVISIIICSVICFFSCCGKAYCSPQQNALKFMQIHYFMGSTEVTITKHAIRMDNTGRLHFSLVAKAPDWTVTVFRNDDKTYYSESLKQLESSGLVAEYLVTWRDRTIKDIERYQSSTTMLFGLQAQQLTSRGTLFMYVPLSQVFNADREIETIMYASYKLSTCGGIPLKVAGRKGKANLLETINMEGQWETYLDTVKIIPVSAKPEDFLAPKGYKRAKSIREVVAGANSRTQSKEVMDMFNPPKEVKEKSK